AVVGEEDVFAFQHFTDRPQALSNVGDLTGIDEGYRPVADIALKQFDIAPARRQRKVIGETLVVVEKVILDHVATVTETQNEVAMSVMGVIAHHMPDDGAVAKRHHRLWDGFRVFLQSGAQSAAK